MEKFTVKQARNLKGYSQQYIADKMNIDLGTYRRIEKHPEKTTIERATMFCSIVEQPLDNVIFFDL